MMGYSPSMNYRHAFHAGNFADILKHVVLAQCVSHLTAKDKPFRYIHTHAGIGGYDLTSEEAERSPEWRDGIERLWNTELPEEVADLLAPFMDVMKRVNEDDELTSYPGSPDFVARLSRNADRLHLCELHPADCDTLAGLFAKDLRGSEAPFDGSSQGSWVS